MVSLSTVNGSNARIATSLPAGMVAVFVGATSGIGEYTLKAFAQQTKEPTIYLVGRSDPAAKRIVAECKVINPGGTYIFIKADVSLLKNVDEVCEQILAKEDSVNLLFQTQGTMVLDKTSEGLSIAYVLPVTSRILFTINLLPALKKANSLRRVVSVFAGGFEGYFDHTQWSEFPAKKPTKSRGHLASMITVANNAMARQAPAVSFIHIFPGGVKTPFGKDAKGGMAVARMMFNFFGFFFIKYLPPDECGARQLYCATSARFPPAAAAAAAVVSHVDDGGVSLLDHVTVARGTDGKPGSGSYTINFDAENVSLNVDKLLAQAREDGMEEKLWAHILQEIEQATGRAR